MNEHRTYKSAHFTSEITVDNTYVGETFSFKDIETAWATSMLFGDKFAIGYERKWLFFKKYIFIITGCFAHTKVDHFKVFRKANNKEVNFLIKKCTWRNK